VEQANSGRIDRSHWRDQGRARGREFIGELPALRDKRAVREHIEGKDVVNLPELVAKMGESLVELILLGPEDQWGNLLAEAIRDIGEVFLEKSGAVESDTTH
jgi:hypothetical protein